MTVDFSDWVASSGEYFDAFAVMRQDVVVPVFIGLLIVGGGFFYLSFDKYRRVMLAAGILLLVDVVAFAGYVLVGAVATFSATPDAPSFTTVAEQRFQVGHLICDPACPTQGLPKDGTRVVWLDDGRTVEGRLFVDGTRVTLAPDATGVE